MLLLLTTTASVAEKLNVVRKHVATPLQIVRLVGIEVANFLCLYPTVAVWVLLQFRSTAQFCI